jgi:hypothetical protein
MYLAYIVHTYVPTHLLPIYLPTYLPTYLGPTHLFNQNDNKMSNGQVE